MDCILSLAFNSFFSHLFPEKEYNLTNLHKCKVFLKLIINFITVILFIVDRNARISYRIKLDQKRNIAFLNMKWFWSNGINYVIKTFYCSRDPSFSRWYFRGFRWSSGSFYIITKFSRLLHADYFPDFLVIMLFWI